MDTYYDMDEQWKHYAKWKNPVTKGYDIHLYEMSGIDKSAEIGIRLVVARDWEEKGMQVIANDYGVSFGGNGCTRRREWSADWAKHQWTEGSRKSPYTNLQGPLNPLIAWGSYLGKDKIHEILSIS